MSKLHALHLLSTLLFILIFPEIWQPLYSLNTVTGKILNTLGKPVYPATVLIEGTTIGGHSDENGIYRLNHVPAGKQIIFISGLGLKISRSREATTYESGNT